VFYFKSRASKARFCKAGEENKTRVAPASRCFGIFRMSSI
jgi:hypothetical protein